MQLFYNSNITSSDQQFTFDKVESRHIVKVLRKKEGDFLNITNGNGFLFTAKIDIASEKKCTVTITKVIEKNNPRPYKLHIGIAPTKNNDRFEWFLEKATEIGIDEITPLICERSERKVLKLDRMQKIIESASKQSLKYHFPVLHEPISFKDFVNKTRHTNSFIAHCENNEKEALHTQLIKASDTTILIGPEGDFSLSEIQIALKKGYLPVHLGESRLRTETAGIVAVHTVAIQNA